MRAHPVDFGGDLDGHQRQGIPTDIHGQVPTALLHPGLPSKIPPEWVTTEKSDGGGHSGVDLP